MSGRTVLVPYDPDWPVRATQVITEVRSALGGSIQEIEHVGSTSVPGLLAKPVLDLMASAVEFGAVIARSNELERCRLSQAPSSMARRLLFVRAASSRDLQVHLHIVDAAAWPTLNQRLFRDFMRAHQWAAHRYRDAKLRASSDADSYTRNKTAAIQEIMDEARREAGLPPTPVWEVS